MDMGKAARQLSLEGDLFGDGLCWVDGSPAASGFEALYLPDRFRRITGTASCRYRSRVEAIDPYLLVRVLPNQGRTRLAVSLDGIELEPQTIPSYGTYYFPLPALARAMRAGHDIDVRLRVLVDNEYRDDAGVCVYEIKLIDVEKDEFPGRAALREKLALFSSSGGKFYETLSRQHFPEGSRLLEVGSGEGHLACLMSAFSGVSVTGIDIIEYEKSGFPTVRERLTREFEVQKPLLRGVPRLESMATTTGLKGVMERTSHLTMSAEEMAFPDESFDFVYSLNVMEHVPNPDRAFKEISRVLRAGGRALLQYEPLYYSDCGSHLPSTLGFNRPWAQLVMTPDEIKQAILTAGGVPNEVDNILASLNGHKPSYYFDAMNASGLTVQFRGVRRGFTIPGAGESREYRRLLERYSNEDLTTIGMTWVLEKPRTHRSWLHRLCGSAGGSRVRV